MNKLEQGSRPPAGIVRKNGSRYLWQKEGIIYIQKDVPEGKNWVPEAAVYKADEEVLTDELWTDGKPVYRKLLQGSSFATGGSYGNVDHGVPDIDTLVEASGYVGTPGGPQYATYANYIDGGKFYWFWTSAGNLPYHFWITYTKQ